VLAAAETAQGSLSPSARAGVNLDRMEWHRPRITRTDGRRPYRFAREECAMPIASDTTSSHDCLYVGIDIVDVSVHGGLDGT